jgi:hypothetical protein
MVRGERLRETVTFDIQDKHIVALRDDKVFLRGKVTLCDDGKCRIKADGQELELWQFRKRALEALFFEF